MATDSASDVREALSDLGRRRVQKEAADKEMTQEIKDTLRQAEAEGVSKSEMARRLGVARTTLYRVYGA